MIWIFMALVFIAVAILSWEVGKRFPENGGPFHHEPHEPGEESTND